MNRIELEEKLEELIDTMSLRSVLEAIQSVCHEKAVHLCTNWQDYESARHWSKIARRMDEPLKLV